MTKAPTAKSPTTKPIIEIADDAQALAELAADWLLAQAQAKSGTFSVALSGGSTPRRLYQLLASAPRRELFPWNRTSWFWGDERFVPYDDPASNYLMVREAMLARAPVPPGNIHPMPTEGLAPDAAASVYERTLKQFYGADDLAANKPLFDVVLLGLGTNGHTASLFPGMAVLQERRRWVGTMADPEAGIRLTLTYPALESCRETAFLVAGADKRAVLRQVLAGDASLPAAVLQPQGTLRFFVDRAAYGDGRS
jgi:6-phosphogluconolactonase